MSDGSATAVGETFRVLVVGDSPPIERTADALSSAFDAATLRRERSIEGVRERLAASTVHCLVCEFSDASDGEPTETALAELVELVEQRETVDGENTDSDDVDSAAGTDTTDSTDDGDDTTDGTPIPDSGDTAVPIVAVTDSEFADAALEVGATDVVETNDSPAVVVARIRNVARQHRLRENRDGRPARPTRSDQPADRYRSILENADSPVCVLTETGEFTDANPAVESRVGYTPAELEGERAARFVHPDDRDELRRTLSAVSSASVGATERVTLRFGTAADRWRVVELTCVSRLDDPSVGGIVVTMDETAPAAAADLGDALDRLEEPFFTLGSDWEIRYANAAARQFLGGDTAAKTGSEPTPPSAPASTPVTGTVVWDLLDDDLRETFVERFHEASATGSVVRFETTSPVLDGDDGTLEVTVTPGDDGVSVSLREFSDDRPASTNRDVIEDRDRLALLEETVDALEDGVAVLEGATIRVANATLRELAGVDTLVGTDVDALFDDDLVATIRERAASPVVRWLDPVQGELVGSGPDYPRPVDVFVTPLPTEERTLCVVRDRERSSAAALSTLCRTITTLHEAGTRSGVRQAVVDGVLAHADAEFAGWYLIDDDVLRPAAIATADSVPRIEPPTVDHAETPLTDRLDTEAAIVDDQGAFEPFLVRSGLRAERVLAVPVSEHDVVVATSTEPMAFEALDTEPVEALADAGAIALERAANRTRVRECRHERTRLESALSHADQVRTIERRLLDAGTREGVEQRLCEEILALAPAGGGGGSTSATGTADGDGADATAGSIELARVGHVAAGSETITPATWAGRGGDRVDSRSIPLDPEATAPAGRAAARREPAQIEDLEAVDVAELESDEATALDPDWRREALERGFRSVLSIPIEHDEFRYGTLTLYADQPSAFDDRGRLACEHLAAVAGYAIGALERKRALLSDSVTELEVVLRDADEPLSAIAHHVGQRIDVQAVVPRSDGGSTVYCTVPGIDDEAVREIRTDVDELAAVDAARLVGDGVNGSPIEFVVDASTIAGTLATHGGVLRSITPVEDRTRLVIELSSTADVRSFVRMIERAHPETELVARRERERSVRPARAFDAELRERLSERQLRTLEAAYYGGFFEWPRESNGEEVAESLDVSQPTFSRHFRAAQRKLFELLFDDRADDG